ncbi:MAG: hypothetical protein ACRD5L_17355, partial [Bryobacteraceae bacterium]
MIAYPPFFEHSAEAGVSGGFDGRGDARSKFGAKARGGERFERAERIRSDLIDEEIESLGQIRERDGGQQHG